MYYPNNQDNWDFYVRLVLISFNNKLKTQIHDRWENLKRLHLASNYEIINNLY